MRKPIISVIIGMSLLTNVYATPGPQETPINLDAEAAVFSVKVPTTMEIHVDEGGVVTTPSIVSIVNNSSAPIKVNNVEITPSDLSEWSIVDFNTDMNREKISSKKVGIQINGCETDSSGIFQFDSLNFPSIAGKDSMILEYDAVVPTQRTEIVGTNIAKVVFTIGWDIADGSESGGGGTGGDPGEGTIPTDPDPVDPDPVDPNPVDPVDSFEYIVATDNQFEFIDDETAPNSYNGEIGYFKYIGDDAFVKVPAKINGLEVRDTHRMFENTSVKGVRIDDSITLNNTSKMFKGLKVDLEELVIDTSQVTDASYMFEAVGLNTLTYYEREKVSAIYSIMNMNTTKMTNMKGMFNRAREKNIIMNLSSWNIPMGTDMTDMFRDNYFDRINISGWNMANVTDVTYMFYNSIPRKIILENFDLSHLEGYSIAGIFSGLGTDWKATDINLEEFYYKPDNMVNLNGQHWFMGSNIVEFDLINVDFSKVYLSDPPDLDIFKDSKTQVGYVSTQDVADVLNSSIYKPSGLTFTVK